mgnify:CR=1 FL=1
MAKEVYSKAWKELLDAAKDEIGASFFLEDDDKLEEIR